MNEHLSERFGRSRNATRRNGGQVELWIMPQQLNEKVAEYFEEPKEPVSGGPWTRQPELPSSSEILDLDSDGTTSSNRVLMTTNRPNGPWESKGQPSYPTHTCTPRPNRPLGAWQSKEEYLSAHWELLREDAVRPLREAVQQVRITPQAKEDAFGGSIGIYEKVHICSVKCSPRGIAIGITFSLFRAGKKILWEQSKRLIAGILVVLTPAEDKFNTKVIVATVAARPLEGLRFNPPEIELFIARAEEQEIDPAQEFWMVEHRGSMYEADRHTLLALQRMMHEPFPLQEHLLGVQANVLPPDYVRDKPCMDLTTVLINNRNENHENVETLRDWPSHPESKLDASQLAALRSVLTKRLAIVQGPPGTGKTFISVQAIKIMLSNRKDGDPPIILACQTNHAIDQLLNHIAEFETEFVRLGGRSKDKGIVKERTLYAVRKQTAENPLAGALGPQARRKMRELTKTFGVLLSPLNHDKKPMDHTLLLRLGILTQEQSNSLESGASQWVQSTLEGVAAAVRSPFFVWLNETLKEVEYKPKEKDFGFEYEEADLEFEQLKDMEAENSNKDDEDFEELSGQSFPVADNWTCTQRYGMAGAKWVQGAQQALKEQNMWKIPESARPAVYRYLQAEMKKAIRDEFRAQTKTYNELAEQRRIGMFQEHERILKKQKIIGMTTTGLSKYRGLLASLEPRIVLIEEAAEVLEAPVSVACLPSIQHLILVGDHKQLRPHCKVKYLENHPFYLNVSLFERLINNSVEYKTLSKQRRMIPEIRRVLHPIYQDIIKDHASVLNSAQRPPVPGMGGVNSWFFTHQWAEQRDDQSSAYNDGEVDMIVGFVRYLMYNGMTTEKITVLTFYNGQRKKILSRLRHHPDLPDQIFNVVTVDSYQGEENEVVILSLVRSNERGQIGFLNIDNRVCVALSRAKCGFYIFGNGLLLYEFKDRDKPPKSPQTWNSVIRIMTNNGPEADRLRVEPMNRVSGELEVRCQNHNNVTLIEDGDDWDKIKGGGCEKPCPEKLACGHACPLTCHPFDHDMVICQVPCGKRLTCCNRPCKSKCGQPCVCADCKAAGDAVGMTGPFDHTRPVSPQSSASSWQMFAKDEPIRYADAVESINSSRQASPDKAGKGRDSAALPTNPPMSIPTTASSSLVDVSSFEQLSISDDAILVTKEVKGTKAGGRTKWVMTTGNGAGEGGGKKTKDWSSEASLLD